MDKISKVIRNTNEENQSNVNWSKVWSSKYSILKRYQSEVDINECSKKIRNMLDLLQKDYGYSELDSMLVLKDILAHEYLNNQKHN